MKFTDDSEVGGFLRTTLNMVVVGAILGIAFFLRLHLAQQLPFHADESTQASILKTAFEEGYVKYDPLHHHGPTPVYLRKLFVGILSGLDWEKWSEVMLRMAGIGCGVATIGLCFIALLPKSLKVATACGLLMATHPYLIYYHAQAIHEPIFLFFGLAFLIGLHHWGQTNALFAAIFTGLMAGLFQSSKETWILLPGCAFLGWMMTRTLRSHLDLFFKSRWAFVFWGSALFVSVLLYSGLFQNSAGIIDSFRTYWTYQTEVGHEKRWSWYLEALLGLHPFSPSLLLCALIWIVPWIPTAKRVDVPVWVHDWKYIAIIQCILYSCIPYKTPWLLLFAWTLILPAAAAKGLELWQDIPLKRGLAVIFAIGIAVGTYQLKWEPGSAASYPYSYSATSSDLLQLLDWVGKEEATLDHQITIAVEGGSYWPLPWYLRKNHSVGYFEETPPKGFDLILKIESEFGKRAEENRWEFRQNLYLHAIRMKNER